MTRAERIGKLGRAIITYLTHQTSTAESKDEKYWETLVRAAVYATVKPIFALLFGAIIKLWL